MKYNEKFRPVVKYMHHGVEVTTFAETQGKHREFCLCHNMCKFFKPGEPDNCGVAEENFQMDVQYGLTTPVIECPMYAVVE